jgi:hypothetical protein
LNVGLIEERFLHCASQRVRSSEREEKASARFGRDDRWFFGLTDRWVVGTRKSAPSND